MCIRDSVNTLKEAQASPSRRLLAEDFTVAAGGSREFTFQYKTDCSDSVIPDFAVLETDTGPLYDNAVIKVQGGTSYYTVQYLNRCTGMRCV